MVATGKPGVFNYDEYSNDESEFLIAISRFRDKHDRKPTIREALRILMDLGYRRHPWTLMESLMRCTDN